MPLEVKREALEVVVCAELSEVELEDLVRCATSKHFPPRGSLTWHDGYAYCLVYRWIERPKPRIFAFEACRAKMPEYRPYAEIRVPSLINVPIVRAKSLDLLVIQALVKK